MRIGLGGEAEPSRGLPCHVGTSQRQGRDAGCVGDELSVNILFYTRISH